VLQLSQIKVNHNINKTYIHHNCPTFERVWANDSTLDYIDIHATLMPLSHKHTNKSTAIQTCCLPAAECQQKTEVPQLAALLQLDELAITMHSKQQTDKLYLCCHYYY